ncbi:MAG: hypothetical protein LBE11_06600, partial [Prevotellaceae bacterium]|nr:hypothetical protein [Prevotellaceae bacterium]
MNNYFFKCDISGIQSFIFNVPSDGATQEIKKRSIFVTKISEECLEKFKQRFNYENIYKGGGNFHVRILSELNDAEIQKFIDDIQKSYLHLDIFPYIAFIKD